MPPPHVVAVRLLLSDPSGDQMLANRHLA
jgi:hypothetical protein